MMSKDAAKKLSDEDIKICYNEYMRRYKKNNKELINSYKRNYYKKYIKKELIVGNTTKDNKVDADLIALTRPSL